MTRLDYLKIDVRMDYMKPFSKGFILDALLRSEQFYIRQFVRALRSEEYYSFVSPNKFLMYFWRRKKNKLGAKLGFFIPSGCFGPDLKIWHYGSIIVNPHSRIGSGCTLHGNCCIGNKGQESYEGDSPVIGDNVNIGQGAQLLGPITVADNVTVAAGSIVVKSVDLENSTVGGVPARFL